jgi:hypothetical protein
MQVNFTIARQQSSLRHTLVAWLGSALGLPRSWPRGPSYFVLIQSNQKSSQADRCHFTGQTPGRAP